MDDEKDLFRALGEDLEEGVVDPFWDTDWESGVRCDPLDVRHFVERLCPAATP